MAKQILKLSAFIERPEVHITIKGKDGDTEQTVELYGREEMSVVDGALLQKWLDEMGEIETALISDVSDPPTNEQKRLADRHVELKRKFVAKVSVDLQTETLMQLNTDCLSAVVLHFLRLPQRALIAEALKALATQAPQSMKSIGENSSQG